LLLLFLIEKAGLMMTPSDSKNQSVLLRIAPTNQHCGHSATVIITVSNPHTKAIIVSVVFMSKSSRQRYPSS
jgi:hypothetical protein